MTKYVCSNPACRATFADDPKGHCPACKKPDGSGWSTIATEWPRRSCVDLMTPAESAIRSAMLAVEEAGANPLLTEAVGLLGQAQSKVADFVDRERPAT